MVGLFDYLKHQHKIAAKDVLEIIDAYPEFIMQNRRDLLRKKVDLIRSTSKQGPTFIKVLIKRHPDLFLK